MIPKRQKIAIWIVSVLVPLLVAVLIFSPTKQEVTGASWTAFLPHLNAAINSATSLILIAGLSFIKNGNKEWHKAAMLSAFTLGCIFLVSYIIYHSTAQSTIFGDMDHNGQLSEVEAENIGAIRTVYIILLLSHILLAAIVVPFVLFAFYFALTERFDRHRKIVKFTFPIWLYVSISGVIVYLMISPYY